MSKKLNKPYRRGYRIFTVNTTKKNGESTLPPPPLPPDPKSAIKFDIKSDEEIVYGSNYKFNADIEVLINNSKKTRVAKKNARRGTDKTPRRQNAWILYRRDKSMNAEFEGIKSSTVSSKIQEMWQKEPDEVKELFSALSRLAEKKHIEQYGINYKYKPEQLKKSKKNQEISKPKPPPPKNKEKEKYMNMKLNNCEFITTTVNYFNTSSSENETVVESPPSNNDINIIEANSTLNFLPSSIENNRNDIWQDPILQFKLNDEYTFINNFREIEEISEINYNETTENHETEISYGIFS